MFTDLCTDQAKPALIHWVIALPPGSLLAGLFLDPLPTTLPETQPALRHNTLFDLFPFVLIDPLSYVRHTSLVGRLTWSQQPLQHRPNYTFVYLR